MDIKNIYTFGDGYATGHLWPEWPQILQALVTDYQVVNTAGIGAGPEYLVHKLVQQLDEMRNSYVIFQWPSPNRFDKLIENDHWVDIANNDPVYHFNIIPDGNRRWWLSSASTSEQIQTYHDLFVQPAQHKIRLDSYKILVQNTLKNIGCEIHFTSLHEASVFSNQTRFQKIRQKEVQPSPLVHYYFLIEKLLPNTDIKFDSERAQRLEQLILEQNWQAYDPDRAEIWNNLVKKLNSTI
jgi:hypothetical protein